MKVVISTQYPSLSKKIFYRYTASAMLFTAGPFLTHTINFLSEKKKKLMEKPTTYGWASMSLFSLVNIRGT